MTLSFSKLIDNAHENLHNGLLTTGDEEIVAVVPTQPSQPLTRTDTASGAVAPFLGLLGLPLALLTLLRAAARKYRSRDSSTDEKSLQHSLLLIFRQSRLDVHDQRRGRAGEFVESYTYDRVHSYGRSTDGMAVETWLRVDDFEFLVPGWYERDLRKVLDTVGVSLDAITGASAIRQLDNPAGS